MVCTAAGNYAKFTKIILKDLIIFIDLNRFVASKTIREFLQRALPIRKYISSNDVVNTRVKAKLLIKQILKVWTNQSKLFKVRHYWHGNSMLKGSL